MFGGGSERVTTLAEAIDRLTIEVRASRDAWAKSGGDVPDGVGAAIKRLAASVDSGLAELRVTNQRLQTLARTPILGALGGGAQQSIDKLCVAIDRLVASGAELRRLME